MRAVSGVALAVVIAVAGGASAVDKDSPFDGKKLVGKWEPKDPRKDGKAALEFTKDGRLAVVAENDGKVERADGTYKLAGNKLSIVMKVKDTEVREDVTLLKLTDGELVTEDPKGKKESWKKLKGDN